jgi:hypothetical protein
MRRSVLGCLGEAADVHPAMTVEPECARVTVAKARDAVACRVGEPVQFAELQGAVGVFDVAEDAAGADGGSC